MNNPEPFDDWLIRAHNRPRPGPWEGGGNLPWDEPDFSRRMLREHLDESHDRASRTAAYRAAQVEWVAQQLTLQAGSELLDLTCGPGLYAIEFARRGCRVTGVDFAPAAILYARDRAEEAGLTGKLEYHQADIRGLDGIEGIRGRTFDAALILYGQLAVFPPEEAAQVLRELRGFIRPGGRVVVELIAPDAIDRTDSSWWTARASGIWGDEPYVALGERWWDEATGVATERFTIVDAAGAREFVLCDQAYTLETMSALLAVAGFDVPSAHPGEQAYDGAKGWTFYVARRP